MELSSFSEPHHSIGDKRRAQPEGAEFEAYLSLSSSIPDRGSYSWVSCAPGYSFIKSTALPGFWTYRSPSKAQAVKQQASSIGFALDKSGNELSHKELCGELR